MVLRLHRHSIPSIESRLRPHREEIASRLRPYRDDIRSTSFIELMFLMVFVLMTLLVGYAQLSDKPANARERDHSLEKPEEDVRTRLVSVQKTVQNQSEKLQHLQKQHDDLKIENKVLSSRLVQATGNSANGRTQQEEIEKLRREREEAAKTLGENEPLASSRSLAEVARIRTDKLQKENADLRGQLRQLTGKEPKLARGAIGQPPCWTSDLEGKQPDSIYVITFLRNGNMRVQRNWTDKYQAQINEAPFLAALDGKTLSEVDFGNLAMPIYERSVAQGCRHFVVIYKEPGASNAYDLLREVGRYFYHIAK